MVRRFVDAAFALCGLVTLFPLLAAAAVAIKLSSQGPILYRAKRMARDRRHSPEDATPVTVSARDRRQTASYGGREFTMYKFRTMSVDADKGDPITAWKDPRVFPIGAWLRKTKIDELPQLLNVLKGEMAVVGPRPESPEIVRRYYTREDRTTLQVRPGLTSPGTLYYYTHCETALTPEGAMDEYAERVLPLKLALDRLYLQRASLSYDIRLIARTALVLLCRAAGFREFPDPPELRQQQAAVLSRMTRPNEAVSSGKVRARPRLRRLS